MHDLAFVGMVKDGVEGFAVWVGGGLSSTPRLARKLGLFVPKGKVLEVAKAVVDIWSEDPENRRSFVRARIKYFIDKGVLFCLKLFPWILVYNLFPKLHITNLLTRFMQNACQQKSLKKVRIFQVYLTYLMYIL